MNVYLVRRRLRASRPGCRDLASRCGGLVLEAMLDENTANFENQKVRKVSESTLDPVWWTEARFLKAA